MDKLTRAVNKANNKLKKIGYDEADMMLNNGTSVINKHIVFHNPEQLVGYSRFMLKEIRKG